MTLKCALVVRQIFSDSSLYHYDSKLVQKDFSRIRFESLWYRDSSEKICRTTRAHSNTTLPC